MGQVIEVSPLTCRVRLISDPQSGVSVVLQSNRAEGVVRGSIAGLLYLEDLDTSTEVNVGDVVITSGLGGSYFRGVALGTVVNVINAAGTSDRTIVVEPFSSADPLEELTVVLRMGSEGDLSGTSDASSSDSSSSGRRCVGMRESVLLVVGAVVVVLQIVLAPNLVILGSMPDLVLVYVGIAAMLLRRDSVLVMAFFCRSYHGPCGNIDGRRVCWALYAYRISYEPGGGVLRQRYARRFACYFYGVLSSGGSALCRFLYFVG